MPPRILFASYHCQDDPASGAAVCTGDLFRMLTARGWACGVVCGPLRDAASAPSVARELAGRKDVTIARGRGNEAGFTTYSHAAAGYPVTVLVPDTAGPAADAGRAFGAVFESARSAFRPDLVLGYGGDPASRLAMRLARQAGIRTVFWLHNFAYTSVAAFADCDAVVVPSVFSRDFYQASLGLNPVVLPYVIDPIRIAAPNREPKYLTFVNPDPAKGVFWFARIAEVLGTTRPDVPILVVEGRGGVDWLGRCGVDLTAVKSLHRMKNTPDPRAFYRVSRLVLMPSLWNESFGRVAAEAMMNSIPVIASDRGALPEVIGDGGLTLPIPPRFTPESRTAPTAEEVAPWVRNVLHLWDDAVAHATAVERAAERSRCWDSGIVLGQWEQFLRGLNCRQNGV
jgi:glycosyltransferase involved in cell wall biosynthesis